MKLLKRLLSGVCILSASTTLFAEAFKINLWKDTPQMRKEHVNMYCSIPDNHNGSAVVIFPGGSYHHLGYLTEGKTTASWFNEQGTCTFIVNYRVSGQGYHYPAMMQDAQKAILYVRQNAEKWGIDKERVGTIGFSAGGHLSGWCGEFGAKTNELEKIGINTSESLRPSFIMCIYPVVTMQYDIGHGWSRRSLLGRTPTQNDLDLFSLEMNVPEDMPPTYLLACQDDGTVIYENSVRFDSSLTQKNIDHIFVSYPEGDHGFAMLNNKFMKKYHWNETLKEWLSKHNFFTR